MVIILNDDNDDFCYWFALLTTKPEHRLPRHQHLRSVAATCPAQDLTLFKDSLKDALQKATVLTMPDDVSAVHPCIQKDVNQPEIDIHFQLLSGSSRSSLTES